jgi:hypothetical protein
MYARSLPSRGRLKCTGRILESRVKPCEVYRAISSLHSHVLHLLQLVVQFCCSLHLFGIAATVLHLQASRHVSTGLHDLSPLPRFHASHRAIFLFQRSSRPSNVCLRKGGGKAPPNHQAHRWCGAHYQSMQANLGTIFCLQPKGYIPQAA